MQLSEWADGHRLIRQQTCLGGFDSVDPFAVRHTHAPLARVDVATLYVGSNSVAYKLVD